MAQDSAVDRHPDSEVDVEEPLLVNFQTETIEEDVSNFWPCTFNLTKVILGAGIMAIPKAISLIGSVFGLAMLLLVAFLTWFTIYALISGSDKVDATTYACLVRKTCGVAAEKALLVILILGCFGFEVVYLDIVSDVLVGAAPSYTGGVISQLINWLLPPPPGPGIGNHWWFASRPAVLGLVSLFILLPLCLQRKMAKLDIITKVGLTSLAIFAFSLVWLATAAVAKGVAYPLRMAPDWEHLGPTPSARLSTLVSVIPVILTAASCHQSIHPLRHMLKPYSGRTLNRVTMVSLAMVTVLFVVVSASTYLAFGTTIQENILVNLSVDPLKPLIGEAAAVLVAYSVRLGYSVSLLGSAALVMFPLRSCLLELIGIIPPPPRHSNRHDEEVSRGIIHKRFEFAFAVSTVLLLAGIYCVAVFIPSIWMVISYVGCIACTAMCFILPAAILLATNPLPVRSASGGARPEKSTELSYCGTLAVRGLGWIVGILGVALLVNGVAGPWLFGQGS